MLKTKKLKSCNKRNKKSLFTMTILSSFLLSSLFTSSVNKAFADEYSFNANSTSDNDQYLQTDYNSENDAYSNNSFNTSTPPTAKIGQLPVVPNDVKDNAIRTKTAFNNAMQEKIGLTPEMIKELKRTYLEKNNARDSMEEDSPIPESRTIPISLGVSNQKEIIRTAVGYSTSISVVDSTGKPWDVVNTSVGNQKAYALSRLDGVDGSLFSLTAKVKNARSNLILVLKEGKGNERKIPISLDLLSGQKEVDDKIVLRIQSVGPNGSIEQTKLTQAVDIRYIQWLDGVLPSDAKKLKSNDKLLKAWKDSDGSIVVITKYLVYSPNSNVMLSSSDGEVTLYKLSSKSSVLRARDPLTKEEKTIRITGF